MVDVKILSPLNMGGLKLRRFLRETFGKYQEFETETFDVSKNGLSIGGFNEIILKTGQSRFDLSKDKLMAYCLKTKQEENLDFMEISVNNSALPL
jgi:hypothetical protein